LTAAGWAPQRLVAVAFGVVTAVIAGILRAVCEPMLQGQAPFLMHIPAVAVASWVAGPLSGMTVAAAGAILTNYLFMAPQLTGVSLTVDRVSAVALFLGVSAGLAWQVGRWRNAERALRTTRDQSAKQAAELRAVLDAVPAAVFMTSQTGTGTVAVNRVAEMVLHPVPAGVDGTPDQVRFVAPDAGTPIPPDDLPVQRAARTGSDVRDAELSVVYGDGATRALFGHAVPLRDDEGRVRGAVGAFVDVSERRRTDAILHRYELLARHTRDILLFVRRSDGRILEANVAAESAYGYTRDELLSRTIHDLRDPSDFPLTLTQMAAADTEGVLFQAFHRRRDGFSLPVEVSSRGMTLDGERVLLSVIRDVTERTRVEESLRTSERRTTALLNAVAESIWLFDEHGRVLLANETAAARLGVGLDEVGGTTLSELLPPGLATARRQRFDEVMATGRPVRFADERDGLLFDHTFYPVFDADGRVAGVAAFSRDDTARRRAEAEVQRLNTQLRTRVVELERLLALTPVGVAIAETVDVRALRPNAALQRLLGVAAGAHVSLVGPEWRLMRGASPLTLEELPFHRSVVDGVDVPPEEYDLVFQDGRVVNVLVSATPLVRDDGSPGGCVGVLVDITDQKRIEAALVEQAEDLQLQAALLANAHDAIIVRTDAGHITFWNRGAEHLYGWTEAEALGRDVHMLLRSDPDALAQMRSALAAKREWQAEMRHHRKDGTLVVVDSRQAIVETQGTEASILEINRDISDRKRAEDQRAEVMARLAVLLELSEALSAAATPEEMIEILLGKAVPAFGAYAGIVAAPSGDGEVEVLGSRGYPVPLVNTMRRLRLDSSSPITDAIRTGSIVIVPSREAWLEQYPALDPERLGTSSHALAAIPLIGTRVVGAIGLSFLDRRQFDSRDATFAALLARQAAQALERADLLVSERRAHSEAEQASRIKDEFLATLSHELRTPLNAILGWSHMLLRDALNPDARRHALEVIARNASSQVRLVDEVLDISRIVRGQLHLELQLVDVGGVIERALDTARPAAAAKGVALDATVPERLVTVADGERIQQVVWNLLSNGVKFTPRGGRVAVAAGQHGSELVIAVRDTGSGIRPEFLPHVFERFTQADSSTTRRYGGLGLGLAIVRHIVELHGGSVAVDSGGEGHGALFTVRLPIRAAVDEAMLAAAPTVRTSDALQTVASLNGIRALVVDDEQDARDVLGTILSSAGARVVLASSPDEALDLLSRGSADVLISDIGMPGEDGYAFIRRVRDLAAKEVRVPAIAVTAYGRPSDRDRALAAGFDQHLAKPLMPQQLIAAVARLVGRRGPTTTADP
jgi:PAS domain S-box-containing protein